MESIIQIKTRLSQLKTNLGAIDVVKAVALSKRLLRGSSVDPSDVKSFAREVNPHFVEVRDACQPQGEFDQILAEFDAIAQAVETLETQVAGLVWAKDLPPDIQTKLEEANAKVTSLTEDFGKIQQKLDEALNENKRLGMAIAPLDEVRQAAQEEIELIRLGSEELSAEYQEEIRVLDKDFAAKQTKLEAALQLVAEAERQKGEAEIQQKALRSQVGTLENQLQEANEKVQAKTKEYTELLNTGRQKTEELKRAKDELQSAKNEQTQLRAQLKTTETDLKARDRKIAEQQKTIEKLKAQIASGQHDVDALRVAVKGEKEAAEEIKTLLREVKRKLTAAEANRPAQEKRVRDLETQAASFKQEAEDIRRQLEQARRKEEGLTQQLQVARQAQTTAEAELKVIRSREGISDRRLEDVREEVTAAQARVEEAAKRVEELTQELGDISLAKRLIEGDLEDVRNQLITAGETIKTLTQDLEAKEQSLAVAQQQVDAKDRELLALQTQYNELSAKLTEAESAKQALEQQVRVAGEAEAEVRRDLVAAQEKLAMVNLAIGQTERAFQEERAINEQLRKEQVELYANSGEIRTRAEEVERKLTEATNRFGAVQEELERARQSKGIIEEELRRITQQNQALRDENDRLRGVPTPEQERPAVLKQKLETANRRLEELTREKANLSIQFQALQQANPDAAKIIAQEQEIEALKVQLKQAKDAHAQTIRENGDIIIGLRTALEEARRTPPAPAAPALTEDDIDAVFERDELRKSYETLERVARGEINTVVVTEGFSRLRDDLPRYDADGLLALPKTLRSWMIIGEPLALAVEAVLANTGPQNPKVADEIKLAIAQTLLTLKNKGVALARVAFPAFLPETTGAPI